MLWLVLFLALLVPGIFLACLFHRKDYVIVLGTPLSLCIYVAISLTTQGLGLSNWVLNTYVALTLLFAAIAFTGKKSRETLFSGVKTLGTLLPVVGVVAAYHYFNGAFIDHGADVFQHMVFVQSALNYMDANAGELKFAWKPGTHNFLFHNIAALFSATFNVKPQALIEIISVAYSALWSISIFCFCHMVLMLAGVPKKHLYLVSFLALFFYWTAFGINNFAFARYYVGGPVILNYCLYIAALIIFIDLLRHGFSAFGISIILILLGTAAAIHPQEAIFFVSYGYGLGFVVLAYRLFGAKSTLDISINPRTVLLGGLIFFGVIAGIVAAILILPKYRFDPISLRNLGFFSEQLVNWNILRPNHQFYTVLGWWGIYVYVLAVFNFHSIKKSVVLMAGLALPVLTVFNPFFAEAYMRIAYPKVLWRLLFALPLPLIAAYLFWLTLSSKQHLSNFMRMVRLGSLAPLVILLISFSVGPLNNLMAKSPSLVKTPAENSYLHWNDLVEYLQTLDVKMKILTDPSTGYVIRSLTQHKHHGFKFYKMNYKEYNFDVYNDHPLQPYQNWLLVVNQRDGHINDRLSRPHHIYPDVMMTSNHYSEQLFAYIRANPDRFALWWRKDGIAVYRLL